MCIKSKIFISIAAFGLILIQSDIYAGSSEIYKMKVGDISVISIMDTVFEMNSSLLKNGNPDTLGKYMHDGKSLSPVNAFIIKTKKHSILIDAGMGAHLLGNMKSIDISPEKIDMVLITHGHSDHVEGLIKDGKTVFQNAKVLFSEKEKPLYEDKALELLPEQYRLFMKAANQVLKVYDKQIGLFVFGDTITEGIVAVDLSGHTAGHCGFLIESKGQKLLIAGDFLHVAPVQFPHPEYSMIYDADVDGSAAKRKLVLEKCIKEKMPVAGMHIPFPGIGNVEAGTVGFLFKPVK
ncbi:MAG TPA: MBL fold metallo-hydrolase [Chitinispirillaceae bacterium]|nr:MBL fold metallo-hydrolase [Chitinispirillaceae bacterium]